MELNHFIGGNAVHFQYRKEKRSNIRSWGDEGDSAKEPEELLEKWLITRQVDILEAKGR